ncbi:sigma-54-dependent transcriptional regulator [Enterococcus columbae]|uniref:Transcriptional antiterminator bglG:Sigma-54 factor n=1 Tax=Enterococcus columbae DSM 7374 = ATCC 51263 TaxID=1121865 RepID=S0KS56_9ENTE|nr:sigma-54-dependent transcriptional regulator [Enterococcus columbae]EOT42061.1 transcriptional antiterminator bglG:Sigma-54 factor [Enterococcus columbae DSM 7374 = ATCC 51263]EOW80618.1 transcriptional antiterminator bglG:Sigma-54 factor [Enterococcus columbae DSM 7374 = ATCC 51263]OJG26305.1 transcriptional antiterminator bglG:Sigma-54 factor [Enterococcus columbae DSM 7374 = ATCC 51263]
MSKRMDRIYQYVYEQTFLVSNGQMDNLSGVTTNEVAEALAIQRTNASKDLNELVRQDRLLKLDGRPVRYVVQIADHSKNTNQLQAKEVILEQKVISKPMAKARDLQQNPDIFAKMIGVKGSMKNAIEQAKAAILYPPKGLNCLITGPTGSGKTYFAHAMFQFAKDHQVIDQDKDLIVFNCADYANNPELLMSHLFGYAKGAFTGADQEKEGVIDQADGGMLFLDEIHRLPPEGQEMVFYFMDHGTYSRLGETGKKHQADVRIVGATTEDPNSALLDTFVRRIPINIQLPAFEKRPAGEQIDLVRVMVAQEAKRIQRTITLTEDVVKALLGSVSFGNIGQLKSNVQLICARGFLNHMQQEQIDIDLDDLSEGIRSGLIVLANKREQLAELQKQLVPKLIVQPNESIIDINTDSYELPYNLYDIIGDKAALLKAEGIDQEAINHFIKTDINVHLKSFYRHHQFSFQSENKLSELVDKRVIEVTSKIYQLVENELAIDYQANFIYAFSLHISSLLKKMNLGEQRHINDNIRTMISDYPEEFALAKKIRHIIEESFSVEILESEDYYLAALLVSLKSTPSVGKIGVVVAAHGKSSATSMVEVVTQLLGVEQLRAVDMPLDMSPKVALEKIEQAVLEVNDGNGVLLLVDMGSLATFSQEIFRDTKVRVRTIDMVTTAVVLEAVRKASVIGADLDSVYDSLRHFRGYGHVEQTDAKKTTKKKAILAICASGEGTAQRIKEILEFSLQKRQNDEIEIVTSSIIEINQRLPEIMQHYQLIASTGIAQPAVPVPFISLEQFIDSDVDQLLDKLLLDNELLVDFDTEELALASETDDTRDLCIQFLERNVTFINPKKVIDLLWGFADKIIQEWQFTEELKGFRINFILHCGNMLERNVLKKPLSEPEDYLEKLHSEPLYDKLHLYTQSLARMLNIELPPVEEYYLLELILNHQARIQYTE